MLLGVFPNLGVARPGIREVDIEREDVMGVLPDGAEEALGHRVDPPELGEDEGLQRMVAVLVEDLQRKRRMLRAVGQLGDGGEEGRVAGISLRRITPRPPVSRGTS
jgi:hypothetical protein